MHGWALAIMLQLQNARARKVVVVAAVLRASRVRMYAKRATHRHLAGPARSLLPGM